MRLYLFPGGNTSGSVLVSLIISEMRCATSVAAILVLTLICSLGFLVRAAEQPIDCRLCHSFASGLHGFFTSKTSIALGISRKIATDVIGAIFVPVCKFAMKEDVLCQKLFENYIRLLIEKFFGFLDADLFCARMGICPSFKIIPDSDKPFIKRTLRDRPPRRIASSVPSQSKPLRIVLFADVHVDPQYKEAHFLRL